MSRYEFGKEWCTNMAALEGDAEIGSGALSGDPDIPPRKIRAWRDWSGGSLRHHWSDRLDGPDTPGAHYVRADTLPQWQPIETAPRHGPFLGVMMPSGVIECCMRKSGVIVKAWDGTPFESGYAPTRWMPQPKPPTD